MKLFRYGAPGKEKPGAVGSDGQLRDLSSEIADLGRDTLGSDTLGRLKKLNLAELPLVAASERIGPCVADVRNFVAVGLNYSDLSENEAMDHVAGFCVCNDVSERVFQNERGGSWSKGKGCPTFGPLGPWLVTPDEIADVQDLDMWLDVDGKRMQTGSTKTMIFSAAFLVSYISQFMILEPGDVITTGTPPGVGLGMKPPRFLAEGSVMSLGIAGLGSQRQTVVAGR